MRKHSKVISMEGWNLPFRCRMKIAPTLLLSLVFLFVLLPVVVVAAVVVSAELLIPLLTFLPFLFAVDDGV